LYLKYKNNPNPQNYKNYYQAVKQKSDEWTKIYHPSYSGLFATIELMIKNKQNRYKIVDPRKGLHNGYNMYLAEWLHSNFNNKNIKMKDLPMEQQSKLNEYNIKNFNIILDDNKNQAFIYLEIF